ncbi:MAG: ABC transporter ATP-binding protein [Pseudomonadota bacterium]
MATNIAVSVRNLTRMFGAVKALDDVSLDVQRGEFVSLLGSSGCGKTTLLRIIGGFEEPSSGDVVIGGHSVIGDPPYRRRTNMVFQHLALFPHLSVAQNIAFGLEMKKADPGAIAKKVKEVLALVRLSGYEDRAISMLSGGQKQRVAIARAIVNDPEVLLLDEPLGALDLQLRLQMHEELKRIHKETGSTWIFVTHDQGEAITLSDRIAVMSEGQIVQLGTPRDIYERPGSRFVAQFVGHANFIDSVCEETQTDGRCTISAAGWRLEGQSTTPLQKGMRTLAVLRHEKLRIAPASATADGFMGRVTEAIYLGPSVRLTVQLENGAVLTAESPTSVTGAEISLDALVRVSWNSQDLVVVPA